MPDGWWSAPALERSWLAVADRLERAGLVAQGRVRLRDLHRDEQQALSGLLGRSIVTSSVEVDLASLDDRLRSRAGIDLIDAAATVTGRVLVDRPARRADNRERHEAPTRAFAAWHQAHPDAGLPPLAEWLDGLRRDGLLGRRGGDPAALVTAVLDVLAHRAEHLTGVGLSPPIARTELAARLFGDAHALDDDRLLTRAILRAVPDGGEGTTQRASWERLGVLSDRISSTCLTFGLRWAAGAAGARASAYTLERAVLHLTWRDLDEGLEPAPGQTVLVCENLPVLEAAAEIGVTVGVVCTSGRANLATIELLDRIQSAGGQLLYHGDFDWAGVAMANHLRARCGVQPWRMDVDDYLAAPASLALKGSRVDASWDPELAAAMAHRGRAVHEEALLPALLKGVHSKPWSTP